MSSNYAKTTAGRAGHAASVIRRKQGRGDFGRLLDWDFESGDGSPFQIQTITRPTL
jgi:hypothetical protein